MIKWYNDSMSSIINAFPWYLCDQEINNIAYGYKEGIYWENEIQNEEICYWCHSVLDSLKTCKASAVITYQLVKSATSTGANYRAACVSRSRNEFLSKICIVVEESDESVYWLEVILEADLSKNKNVLLRLIQESYEIAKIMSKAKSSMYKHH